MKEDMIKIEKIKRIIYDFKNERCPKCSEKLTLFYPTSTMFTSRGKYMCDGCDFSFYENQYYETYFEEITRVL